MELREWRRLALVCVVFCAVVILGSVAGLLHTSFGTESKVTAREEVLHKAKGKSFEAGEDTNKEKTQGENLSKEKKIVVLDAGHGGMDEGTLSLDGRHLEKDYNLLVVKRIRKILEKESVQVYCTRLTDKNISKKKRTALANSKKADLFVSIHCNASDQGDRSANGIETLYSKRKVKNGTISNKKLAQIVLENLEKTTGMHKRGVISREKLYLLHHANVPTTIVEIGYMSNAKDLEYIKKEEGQQKIAQGISNGILQALEEK